jgi:hypothetical protein
VRNSNDIHAIHQIRPLFSIQGNDIRDAAYISSITYLNWNIDHIVSVSTNSDIYVNEFLSYINLNLRRGRRVGYYQILCEKIRSFVIYYDAINNYVINHDIFDRDTLDRDTLDRDTLDRDNDNKVSPAIIHITELVIANVTDEFIKNLLIDIIMDVVNDE